MSVWSVQDTMNTTIDSPIDVIMQDRKLQQKDLKPKLEHLHDPYLMKDMDKGVNRVIQAINNGEHIRISGDYDADGISSTSAMMICLSELGANISYDIPDRKDGYGISHKIIDKAYADGVTLIITCDNGITAVEQVKYAKSKGIDVIITDHHEPQDTIPDTIVINPMQRDCPYPFKKLAGVAVAWKFCQAVLQKIDGAPGLVKSYDVLDLVTIGTVADVMDLVGENRIITYYGLTRLNKTNHVGLQELLKALSINKEITAGTIGFTIGPALNATGRLVSAKEAVEMILQKSRLKAMRSAKYLADLNNERKEWTQYYTDIISTHLEAKDELPKVIVYAHLGIPEGIIGIIASRLKEKYNRPILLMTNGEDGIYKGSGRSIHEYNLFENLMKHKDLFKGVGGHAMACGFSIEYNNIEKLHDELNSDCLLKDEDMIPKVLIDYDIDYSLVTLELAEKLNVLEPFGKGNPKPTFCMTDVKVLNYKPMGKEQNHLRLEVAADTEIFSCIGWNMIDKMREIAAGKDEVWLDIAFKPGVNEWNNRKSLQLELQDIREAQN